MAHVLINKNVKTFIRQKKGKKKEMKKLKLKEQGNKKEETGRTR